MERNSFVFYQSFYEAIKELPREIQGEVLTAIIEYGLNGVTTEDLKPIARGMLTLIKPQIDANNQRFENGCMGGRPKKERSVKEPNNNQTITKPKPNNNQTETKQEPNVNDNVNVNENEKRDNSPFIPPSVSEVIAYFDEKGYSEEAANNFFAYYDELSWYDKNGNAMKNWKLKAINVWFKPEHRKRVKSNKWGLSI